MKHGICIAQVQLFKPILEIMLLRKVDCFLKIRSQMAKAVGESDGYPDKLSIRQGERSYTVGPFNCECLKIARIARIFSVHNYYIRKVRYFYMRTCATLCKHNN